MARKSFSQVFLVALALLFPFVLSAQNGPQLTDPKAGRVLNLPTVKNPTLPTVFLVGDSTVRNGKGDGSSGQWGWGEPIVDFFDLSKVNVVNRAIGGRSSRTYITEGHWDDVLAMLKPGDFVLIQFGHNDSGALDDTSRARGTIPGIGEESKEIDNPITKKHEVVHTFGWYLKKYVEDAKAKGATPILCSLIPRKIWKEGKIVRGSDSYAGWTKQVAEEQHVGFLDLNNRIAAKYEVVGQPGVEAFFGDEHTHTSRIGAELNAACVVSELQRLPGNPLARYFSPKAKDVSACDAK